MRLKIHADCMASSAPNPYGQPQVKSTSSPGSVVYYNDYSNQIAAADNQRIQQQQLAQQHMTQDGGEKPLVHPSASLASYDSYIGGMSSDSELTTASTAARHHHRPYSSQSRVYHAHPVPRNATTASRLSHFSNSTANVQSTSNANSFHVLPHQQSLQQQQQLQQLGNTNEQTMSTNPSSAPISSISHQGSVSSSGSASSNYLPVMNSTDSPLSPILMQQQAVRAKTGGRRLPQRPFKQSMSIDQHSMSHQYQTANSGQLSGHSPAHNPTLGPHRNFVSDPVAANYQQSQKVYQAPARVRYDTDQYNDGSSPRNTRLDIEMIEKQAAHMNLYDPCDMSIADLPPTGGSARSSSSSSGLHLTNVHSNQGSIGSISLDQQQRQIDPFHQKQQKALSQDPYANNRQHQHQTGSASTEWLPPIGTSGQLINMGRPGGQFKQTMSIDHYTASKRQQQQQQHQQQQQQQQQQFSPARQSQFASSDPYHQIGSYSSPPSQHLFNSYDPAAVQQSAPGYFVSGMNQDPRIKYHYPPPQQHIESGQQAIVNPEQKSFNRAEHASTVDRPPPSHLAGHRPKLQHQPSSSSSNSNLSGSLISSHTDYATNADRQVNSDHQKSISSASTSHHYQQSPQHKMPTGGHNSSKQDAPRLGYTSVIGPSGFYGGDFGGSQNALSDFGDMSASQTSHSGALNKRSMRAASPSIGLEASSSSGPHHSHHHHHSTSSSHGIRDDAGMRSESSTGLPNGSGSNSTLTKKSNSATQLSMTGTKKRLGFRKKQVTSFSVHRSEEVAPLEARHLVKQGSSVSEGDSSMSGDSSSRSWSNTNFKQQTSEELASMSFIDGLGKGQMISRQGLASPYLGDIQLSLCDRRGNLEVEIIRARNLQAKTNKVLPLTYVKLYLVKNRKCLAKAKTTLSNKRTLNPLFQQQLTFHEDYHGCILQSIIWGNFGKMDKKNFMGIAQISIDDLELSDTVISWYKLFLPSSLQTLPSKSLRHTLLSNSTESFTTTNN